jgi:hypothetical protein
MPTQPESERPLQIGSILKRARERQGIDIETVEDETKIRPKYLRALENEEWDVLPGPAYTRGFLRAYGDLLGLDSDVLVDEYRRRHEGPSTATYEHAEPILRGRRRLDGEGPPVSWRVAAGTIIIGIVLVLLVLGLTAGGDEERDGGGKKAEREKRAQKEPAGDGSATAQANELPAEVTVKLVAGSDLQACLVDDQGEVLVPDQLLTAGVEDGPYVSKRFRIELDPAAARVFVNGEPATRPSPEPAAYTVTPEGVRPATYTGALCP